MSATYCVTRNAIGSEIRTRPEITRATPNQSRDRD